MRSEDDFGFVRNYLDADLADDLNIFVYDAKKNGEIKVTDKEIHRLHEAILGPKFNFGAPRVTVMEMGIDGRGLDTERARKVIDYIHQVWRRPVTMHTLDAGGKDIRLEIGKAAA